MKFSLSLLFLPPALALHGLKETLLPLSSPASPAAQAPAVFVTDYLPDAAAAQKATAVDLDGWNGPTQHAGFLTFVGQRPAPAPQPEVNTFFWYLPSLDLNPDAPLLIWLQGGPGGSSLYGMFEEIGPMGIDANNTLYERSPVS